MSDRHTSKPYRLGQHMGDGVIQVPLAIPQAPRLDELAQPRPHTIYDFDFTDKDNWIIHRGEKPGAFACYVADYRHIVVTVSTDDAELCLRMLSATHQVNDYGDLHFDFLRPQSMANRWDYVGFVDYATDCGYGADSGAKIEPGEPTVKHFMVNTDGMDWVGLEIFNYVSGIIDIDVQGYNAS